MFDFSQARRFMIEGQIRTNDVTDGRIVAAMSSVPREHFVPDSWRTLAYSEHEIPVGGPEQADSNRKMLTPMVLGKLLRAADIQPQDFVLIVGAGNGYSAALIASLANSVVALDEEPLAQLASKRLSSFGVENVATVSGQLADGHPAAGPYDVILIEGSVEVLPDSFIPQLKDDGRLITVVGTGRSGEGTIFRRSGSDQLSSFPLFSAAAQTLPGFSRGPAFVF
ncbi:protein-L-isoaspartate O-methyltransferase family protein [Terrihabitans sp. B22-R8]|uniref:protein-L-isoaspartate O-methyltransferase family protein n=1 Tax=Terrihabitans sp. B22-R8 TaxID=3425128 RepID=UPI00403C2E51